MDSIEVNATCPYCGEEFSTFVDPSEDDQEYVEDCFICCRPIRFSVACTNGILLSIQTTQE